MYYMHCRKAQQREVADLAITSATISLAVRRYQ